MASFCRSRLGLQLGVVALQVTVIALTITSGSHLVDERRPSVVIASTATAAAAPSPLVVRSERISPAQPPPPPPGMSTAVAHSAAVTRPQVRSAEAAPLVFIVGPLGSGHEVVGQALMRMPDVLPMTLVQEQSFVHLWWNNSGRATAADVPADAGVLHSAAQTLHDWSHAARASGRRLAFGARGCLRSSSNEGGDCSWISGIGLQLHADAILGQRTLEWAGEAFAYPFGSDAGADPGAQRTRFPRLMDLHALCAAAAPPLALRVLALRRPPITTLARAAIERPAPFWRPSGRAERLAKLSMQIVDGGRRAAAQLQELPSEAVRVVDVDTLLRDVTAAPSASSAAWTLRELASFTSMSATNLAAALRTAAQADDRRRVQLAELVGGSPSASDADGQALLRTALAAASSKSEASPATSSHTWETLVSQQLMDSASVVKPPQLMDSASVVKPRWQSLRPTPATTAAALAAAAAARSTADVAAPTSTGGGNKTPDGVMFTHVVNPFFADSSEHQLAMRLTFASIAAASAYFVALLTSCSRLACLACALPELALPRPCLPDPSGSCALLAVSCRVSQVCSAQSRDRGGDARCRSPARPRRRQLQLGTHRANAARSL